MKTTSLDIHYASELKLLRKSKKIKQIVMAECLGLATQQLYSDLENGKKRFTDDVILKICSMFHISILQFVNDNASSANLSIIMGDEDYNALLNTSNNETKTLIYKRLFLETKIENIEAKLKALQKNDVTSIVTNAKSKIHVMI
jgi:transcriptional regulator with XRE-family HTH domain